MRAFLSEDHFMTQSKLNVAIIMDGNGRWAKARGLPRAAGHRAGVEALRRVVEAAPALEIGTLTVYAFSSDNWRRPPEEVSALMSLMRVYLRRETRKLAEKGIRLSLVGRRDRLPTEIVKLAEQSEAATSSGHQLHLRLAIDYSSRDALLNAFARLHEQGQPADREHITRELGPDIDLLIRTSGEQRLSDFLLWESAYAELHFTRRLWPDFTGLDLGLAVQEFRNRDRRFGGLSAAPPAA